jgi:hypothetical protein
MVDTAAGDRIALANCPFDRGDATVPRQKRGVVADAAKFGGGEASLLMRAWLCAVTIRSVSGAISEATTYLGSACTTTSMPAARAAMANRSSPSATTTLTTLTPRWRSISSVVTPKWREPTRVIRFRPNALKNKRRDRALMLMPQNAIDGRACGCPNPDRRLDPPFFLPGPFTVPGLGRKPRSRRAVACR